MTTLSTSRFSSVRLPGPLVRKPDPSTTRAHARTAVNLLRWRATLAQLCIDYDRLKSAATTETAEYADTLNHLLGQINRVVEIDPFPPVVLDLPSRDSLRIVRVAEQVLEGLIVAAHRCGRADTTVDAVVRRWMRASELDTAIAIADDHHLSRRHQDNTDPSPARIREAVQGLLETWLGETSALA